MPVMRLVSYVLSWLSFAAFFGCAGSASAPGSATANQLGAARIGAPARLKGDTFPIGSLHGKTRAELGSAKPAGAGWISPAAKSAKLVYLSSLGANSIGIYAQKGANQSPMGTITDGLNYPCCMTVDDAGNL